MHVIYPHNNGIGSDGSTVPIAPASPNSCSSTQMMHPVPLYNAFQLQYYPQPVGGSYPMPHESPMWFNHNPQILLSQEQGQHWPQQYHWPHPYMANTAVDEHTLEDMSPFSGGSSDCSVSSTSLSYASGPSHLPCAGFLPTVHLPVHAPLTSLPSSSQRVAIDQPLHQQWWQHGPGPSIATSNNLTGPPGSNLFLFYVPNETTNW